MVAVVVMWPNRFLLVHLSRMNFRHLRKNLLTLLGDHALPASLDMSDDPQSATWHKLAFLFRWSC